MFLSYTILCQLCHLHQRNHTKTKFKQFRIYFNVSCQVHIVEKRASTKHVNLIAQFHNTEVKWSIKPCLLQTKKVSKALRQKLVEWIMKNSNVCESPIARDTLLIKYVESGVKLRVPKLLLECYMRQLYNDLIASLDDVGLLGFRHANTNDVIIIDTILRSLAPPQLRPMIDNSKMICGCAVCNNSKYFKELFNTWWWKQLKIIKDKADSSRGKKNMN